MAFYLKTESASPKTHTRRFSCRSKNAYRLLQVENPGSRFYSANLARWICRDPIAETGGANLFAFVRNSPVDQIDLLGMDNIDASCPKVYWEVTDSGNNVVARFEIGTHLTTGGAASFSVTINAEFGGFTRDLADLATSAGGVDSRFGPLDSFEAKVQKAAIKLLIKYTETPKSYTSLEEAGIWGSWLARGKSQGNGYEWGGWIKKISGTWVLSSTTQAGVVWDMANSKSAGSVDIEGMFPIGKSPYGANPSAVNGWFHNHPSGLEGMSDSGTGKGDVPTQGWFKKDTKEDDDPDLYSEFGYALSPKGVVFKTDGSDDEQVYPK